MGSCVGERIISRGMACWMGSQGRHDLLVALIQWQVAKVQVYLVQSCCTAVHDRGQGVVIKGLLRGAKWVGMHETEEGRQEGMLLHVQQGARAPSRGRELPALGVRGKHQAMLMGAERSSHCDCGMKSRDDRLVPMHGQKWDKRS